MTFLRLSILCLILGTVAACGDITVESSSPDTGGTEPSVCTTDSDCTSSLACVVSVCNKNNGTCSETVAAGKCLIGDTCYNEGQSEPGVPCKVCLPDLDQYTFLNKTCGDGETCETSTGDCISDGSQKCGNGTLEDPETCDDGNTTAGDGCSDACATETGWDCSTAGEACSDIDECAADVSPCAANEACTNTVGGFECACAAGFLADADGACQDIDECAADDSLCDVNATCENTDGSYTCTCNTGWAGNDDGSCSDVDECAADVSPCAANEDCTNVDGSFECACSAGYAADADGACQDSDECADTQPINEDFSAVDADGAPVKPEGWTLIWSDMLDVLKADPVSWFVNASGQLQYSNQAGTDYNGSTNGVAALPKMELHAGDKLMASVSIQVSDQGSSTYDAAWIGFLSCGTDLDFDACLLAYQSATVGEDGTEIATMVNLWSKADYNAAIAAISEDGAVAGDFVDVTVDLSAADGWTGWLHFGFDSGDATFNEGSGFIVDDVKVTQVTQVCGANESCTNTDGSFDCACSSGYEPDADGACVDTDECLVEDVCGANEDCVNSVGSYECVCSAGYGNTADDPACVDLNECDLGTSECDVNALCENSVGTYTCTCNSGFTGDGKTCTNIDECAEGTDECGDNATCSDGAPGAGPLCQATGGCDDATCKAAVLALDSFCGASWDAFCASCAAGGFGFGGLDCSSAADACNPLDYTIPYTCTCAAGYALNEDGLTCSDVDECADGTDGCAQNCANNVGGYDCSCTVGYTLDANGLACNDIDECADNNGGCEQNCVNSVGSSACTCDSGYSLNPDGLTCADIDECQTKANNCDVNATCGNTDGSFTCTCNKGYTGDGVTCEVVIFDASLGGKMVFGHHGACSGFNDCGEMDGPNGDPTGTGCATMACNFYGYEMVVNFDVISHSVAGGCTADQQWNLFNDNGTLDENWQSGNCNSCNLNGVANLKCQ